MRNRMWNFVWKQALAMPEAFTAHAMNRSMPSVAHDVGPNSPLVESATSTLVPAVSRVDLRRECHLPGPPLSFLEQSP